MARCFFIGIGGTGAKCAEALIHLCAAGLGPDRCSIMLVDQDEPNGNASGAGACSRPMYSCMGFSRIRALAQVRTCSTRTSPRLLVASSGARARDRARVFMTSATTVC